MADIVIGLNLDNRIFVAKMKKTSFVNQRLIRFSLQDKSLDIDLCHALLNSIIGMFMIEASGFGRGLGVLDNNANKFKAGLCILNPNLLKHEDVKQIKSLFSLVTNRQVLNIRDEIISHERIKFDKAVLNAFGIQKYYDNIKNSLIELYEIRKSVNL
ncbi:MAG: hypothetical protein O3A39_09275 [Proteobacteria bacterium]|nr:hypothetical protein [Pseudomonadota bacterium]